MTEVFTALQTETKQQGVDRQIRNLEAVARRREQVLRLLANRDFQDFIMKFFIVEEAARYVQLSQQPGMSKEDRQNALDMALATGHLKRFLDVTQRMGESAIVQLFNIREEYEELTLEDDEEGSAGE